VLTRARGSRESDGLAGAWSYLYADNSTTWRSPEGLLDVYDVISSSCNDIMAAR